MQVTDSDGYNTQSFGNLDFECGKNLNYNNINLIDPTETKCPNVQMSVPVCG